MDENAKLNIEDKQFVVKKELLCQYSDYFRAMFSGNYVENNKDEIKIDVVSASSMEIIIQYMTIGLIELTSMTIPELNELSVSANFLQITELLKQIEYTLELQLSFSNWYEIMKVAEAASYINLEKYACAFGLFNFESITIDSIPDIEVLYWYLAHPYLNMIYETQVFDFGFKWVTDSELSADALLVVLGCLNCRALKLKCLTHIEDKIKIHENSLVCRVIECLITVFNLENEISSVIMADRRQEIIESCSELVYNETLNLVRESKERRLKLVPCVYTCCKNNEEEEKGPQHVFTFDEKNGFERFVEIGDRTLWGWSLAAWGAHKLVIVGGEYGKGTGTFNKEVAVYDTLKKEWIRHGVKLPPHRHAGVIVHKNQLYIVGGVGSYRVVLASTIVYDLETRTHRLLEPLVDPIQLPALCIHEDAVYAAGNRNIYKLVKRDENEVWQSILPLDLRVNYMVSVGEYIYVTQSYHNNLRKFKPGADNKLELIAYFSNPVSAMCTVGDVIYLFTQTSWSHSDLLSVETYHEGGILALYRKANGHRTVNEANGCCALVMEMPPMYPTVTNYPRQHLAKFKAQAS